jgi:RHS repeat-associated protein
VITYTDFSGHTILKKVQAVVVGSLSGQHAGWACTYYVYDDMDRLAFTITPSAVSFLDNNSWNLSQQMVNDLCFVYTYDQKGRMISKKQPGVGPVNIVYDQRDRPVFMRDANGLNNAQWQATTYDLLDRITSTGMMLANITPALLQSNVNANTGILTVTNGASIPDSITVGGQQDGVGQYVAEYSITFAPGFASDPGGAFVAFIDSNAGKPVDDWIAMADNPVPTGNSIILLTQNFYDDYSQGTKTYTTTDNSLFDPSTNQNALPLASQYNPQTRGLTTVTKVKVITNPSDLTQGNWLETDQFYDIYYHVVQSQNDNALGGLDVITSRYDFAGKAWGACVKHMAGSPTQFTVVSKNTYDVLGRLTDLSKNFNSTFFKDLASYTYDEYEKMSSRILAPGYTGSGKTSMETLNYGYNIQGWLTGINQAYALDQNTYDQWNDFFGLYLGYDNSNNQFAAHQYNGSITGVIWKSQGDNSMRKYDYLYDNMGRITAANFNQRATPADGWSNSAVDLSESVSYNDYNGNILNMQRKGIVPGTTGGVIIDNLTYTYGTTSDPYVNQLARVDESADFAGNGLLGDFKDGTNAPGTNDYIYDNNGNLVQDQNKGITDGGSGGVVYNYLNKPVSITIAGKTLIQYTYDATGVKLSKTVTNLAVTPNTSTTTSYDDEFVYQNNSLQYVLHEEGRVNIITPVNMPQLQLNAGSIGANFSSGSQGVFEYFIKDQLSNVRMVLTEESQTEYYIATMETSSSSDPNLGTDEAKLFGEVDPTTGNPTPQNQVNLTRAATPAVWAGNTSQEVSHLSAALTNQTIGPNMLLKVSAGDMINAGVNYFYYTNSPVGPAYSASDVVTSLVAALVGNNLSAIGEANSGAITSSLGASSSNLSSFLLSNYNSGSQAPAAYISVLFFDEQFNFISPDPNATGVGTNMLQVSSPDDQTASLTMQQKAPKNGWVYIYVSNESNQDVYFDNLSISQVHSPISEENHFYAFGEKIGGLCTIAFNKLANKYHFQGDFSEEEENTLWNEFDLRMYDGQIGRWTGADPYDEYASPYVGMGNDPMNHIDPDGGDAMDDAFGSGLWGTPFGWGLIGGAATAIADGLSGGNGKQAGTAFLAGFAGGFGAYYVDWNGVGSALGGAANWVSDVFSPSYYWIQYNGADVITYLGRYADVGHSREVKDYGGTSGAKNYQTPQQTNVADGGPVPQGDYSIDLRPNFTRKAKTDEHGQTLEDIGVDLLPWGNDYLYSGWGQWRARLEKVNVNSSRDRFYFHDSYKGFSHGCIETYTDLYYDLSKYKRGGQRFVRVQVKYSYPTTIGNTHREPPPWADPNKAPQTDRNGQKYYSPVPGSFPDRTKM